MAPVPVNIGAAYNPFQNKTYFGIFALDGAKYEVVGLTEGIASFLRSFKDKGIGFEISGKVPHPEFFTLTSQEISDFREAYETGVIRNRQNVFGLRSGLRAAKIWSIDDTDVASYPINFNHFELADNPSQQEICLYNGKRPLCDIYNGGRLVHRLVEPCDKKHLDRIVGGYHAESLDQIVIQQENL
ncbi:MAG: hypothetical protein V1660_03125 [archaeon]